MKTFYKITDIGASTGSGIVVPIGFTEYDKSNPPQELQNVFDSEALAKTISNGESLVTAYIQAEVDKFNKANNTAFSDIHAMANYKDSVSYPHATECKKRWDWNEAVWMASRAKQAQALAEGWDAEKFLSELPKFV